MANKMERDPRGNISPDHIEISPDHIERRLDTLDQRLDDIDSTISAIAERAMSRPINISIACPGCGKIIEIGIVGSEKMMRNP